MLKINYSEFPKKSIVAGKTGEGEVVYVGDTVLYYEMPSVVVLRDQGIMIRPIGYSAVISTNRIEAGDFSSITPVWFAVDPGENVVMCDKRIYEKFKR